MSKLAVISGHFDPLHKGHIAYIEAAASLGKVWIILNSNESTIKKKGYFFQDWDDRAAILMAIKGVEMVIPGDDDDGTVNKALQYIHGLGLDFVFVKGGDRGPDNTPEAELCGHLGIEIAYGVGGEKIESSSDLVRRVREHKKTVPVNGEWGK